VSELSTNTIAAGKGPGGVVYAQPPVVRFTGVEKRYGDGPPVLTDLSFAARRRDFISLIGPSGCGKSTILKLISGLIARSAGEIVVEGMEPENAGEELAFVFQEATLLPWLTVARNVEVPMRLRRWSREKRDAQVRRTLELVKLADRAGFYPRQLSGGQKMRVSIARALTLTPRLLLLDEPFGALDEMTRDHLNEELLAIREVQSWTAFFVTHSVAEAVFLSNRILVLAANPGRLDREVTVDLPYPRTAETRLAPEFQRLVADVSRLLHAVEKGAPPP
jgi:NitT/TauT family transport system ATP-binding protein